MNDLATLKSLTSIKPIATLGNTPGTTMFNRFFFERLSAFGSVKNGIVLTINDEAFEDVEDWGEFIQTPMGNVTVRRAVTEDDLQSLSLPGMAHLRHAGVRNFARLLSDDVVVFRFETARWRGVEYPIEELNRYFETLRRAYHLSDEAGVIDVPIVLGSVNHKYTSRAQIESVLYPMAYYFFREDTEL